MADTSIQPETFDPTGAPGQGRRVLIETWGCQMNVADSEQMLGMLQDHHYVTTESAEDADVVLLNTCHIREKAKQKVLSRLGRLREISRSQNPEMQVVVSGCVAQAEGQALLRQAKNIDVLMGPGRLDELTDLLEQNNRTGKQVMAIGFRAPDRRQKAPALKTDDRPSPTLSGRNEVSRFINISQGCDNFCTFCVVPHTRGREISLPPEKVLAAAKSLVRAGAKEITLLGQNVNSYGQDLPDHDRNAAGTTPFERLLADVAGLDGLLRLRFTTSNPHDFSPGIVELFRTRPQLGRHIHLPVQSGDDHILERMKRKVTRARYLQLLADLRRIDSEMAVSTDLIVGFPGETEEQFRQTLRLVEEARFSFIYAFKYSPRKGTAAIRFADQVPEDVKGERLARLNALQDGITMEQIRQEQGKIREVLVQYGSRKEPGIYYGRTDHFRLVRLSSDEDLTGRLIRARINGGNKTALAGDIV